MSVQRPQLFPLLAALAIPAALGAEVYVSPGGSNANSGTTPQDPLRTIQAGVSAASPGDTVNIRAGVYRELVRPASAVSGSPGSPITIRAYDPDGPGGAPPEEVTVSGFSVVTPGSAGVGQWMQVTARPGVWKIDLPSEFGVDGSSLHTQIKYDGEILRQARWPDAPAAFSINYRDMALADNGYVTFPGGTPQPGRFPASYEVSDLPDRPWQGGKIMTSPGNGFYYLTENIISSAPGQVDFEHDYTSSLKSMAPGDPFFIFDTIEALDQPGEAFFDSTGTSGPVGTLYLMPPAGAPDPTGTTVEIRSERVHPNSPSQSSNHAFYFESGSDFVLKDLQIEGAGIYGAPPTSRITLDHLVVEHASPETAAAVRLLGPDCELKNSRVAYSWGLGVSAVDGTVITNNVIHDCLNQAIIAQGVGHQVEYNTVFNTGSTGVQTVGKGARYNYNNIYQVSQWQTDNAAMNSCSAGDLEGLEIAYNWTHTVPARRNAGYGIRFDNGCQYPGNSNYTVHHNVIWDCSGRANAIFWGLIAGYPNHADAKVKIYHNTIEGELSFASLGSTDVFFGFDVRNNITSGFLEGGPGSGLGSGWSTVTTLESNLVINEAQPSNLTGPASFIAPAAGDFRLASNSIAIDQGVFIPGYSTTAVPDLGALESGTQPFIPGARMSSEDYPALQLSVSKSLSGENLFYLSNFPLGRVPEETLTVRVGDRDSSLLLPIFDFDGHLVSLQVILDDSGLTGAQAISYSHDGTVFTPFAISQIDLGATAAYVYEDPQPGGTQFVIANQTLRGFPHKLVPVSLDNLGVNDLVGRPVPLIFDSQTAIITGDMSANGDRLRLLEIRQDSGGLVQQELQFWIDAGLGTSKTLAWVRYAPGQVSLGGEFFLEFGNPAAVLPTDSAVLTDYYSELTIDTLEAWLEADSLSQFADEDSVEQWMNEITGQSATSMTSANSPNFNHGFGDFGGVEFNGVRDVLLIGDLQANVWGYSLFIVYDSPESDYTYNPGPYQRLLSAGPPGLADTTARGISLSALMSPPVLEPTLRWLTGTKLCDLLGVTIGSRNNYLTSAYGAKFKGTIGEILIFSERLQPNTSRDPNRVNDYLRRKWGLDQQARGSADLAGAIDPIKVFVGGSQITDFSVLPDGSIVLPASPQVPDLATASTFEIQSGGLSESLAHGILILDSYETWAGGRLPGEDDDGDRIKNLLEYYLDLDPDSAEPSSLKIVFPYGDQTRPALQFRRRTATTGLTMQVHEYRRSQGGPIGGQGGTILSAPQRVVDADPDGDGSAETVEVDLPVMQPGTTTFYWLSVELTP